MADSMEPAANENSNENTEAGAPSSRVARRLMERRQSGPPESTPEENAGAPMQAYIPEIHGPKEERQPRKSAQPKEKKLLGEALRRSIDEDIEDELAEAMGVFEADPELAARAAAPSPTNAGPDLDLSRGAKHSFRVVDVRGDDVFVDLGVKSEGVVSVLQFEGNLPAAGELIELIVDRYDLPNDIYHLRRPGSAQDADWGSVEKGMIVDAHVKAVNKGGLDATVNGLRAFLPAGQVDIGRIEDLTTLVGKTLRCEVTEANVSARNLVISRKKVMEREREELAQKTRELIAVGKVFDGQVRKLMEFGAFVDIGGVDGLVHVSQISWKKVRHPGEVLREGDKVKVQVMSYEPNTGKLGLSLRQLTENPWIEVAGRFGVGTIVPGKVTRTTDFGAFVELEPGIEGLIHISELSGRRVGRVSQVVNEGDRVEVKILEVDTERQRIALSLKAAVAAKEAALEEAAEIAAEEETPAPPKRSPNPNLKGGTGGSSGPLFNLPQG